MNYRNVIFQSGLLIVVLSATMAIIGAFGLMQTIFGLKPDQNAIVGMFASAAIGGIIGGVALAFTRKRNRFIGRREAMLLVAISWIFGAAIAGLPYFIWAHGRAADGIGAHIFQNFIDCYFESMSGLTTTGATVLTDIRELPPTLLLWRSLTHWFGGLGIVVLFVAVLPSLGVGGKKIYRVEAPGPAPEGLQPTIRDTARVLWLIYLAFTLLAFVAFWIAGMSAFDAICHSFSMVSTGGLSTRNASIGHYDSVAIDLIASFGMLIAGVNFALFYQMTQGRFRQVWKDVELRVYLISKVLIIGIVTWNLMGTTIRTTTGKIVEGTIGESLQYSIFTTIALQTGTGFCNAEYDLWPYVSTSLLIGLMFIGGCAGSTAGGIKVIRFWVAIRILTAEIEKSFRPNVVRPVKIGGSTVDAEMKLSVATYILGFFGLLLVGMMLLAMFEHDHAEGGGINLMTTLTASMSCLCNVGPGMAEVGAVDNYGWFSGGSKIVLSILMALGRLEMFALVVLITPRFWRHA